MRKGVLGVALTELPLLQKTQRLMGANKCVEFCKKKIVCINIS